MDDTEDNAMEDEHGLMSMSLSNLRMGFLQRELSLRGLSVAGQKQELVERLQSALDAEDTSAAHAERGEHVWEVVPGSERGAPTARAGHGLVAFCNRLYLFGGFSASYAPYAHHHDGVPQAIAGVHFNSVHEYNFDARTWKELHPGATDPHLAGIPKPRRHASLVVHGCSLYVYGGFDANDNVLADMWEFNIESMVWTKVQYRVSHNNDPPTGRAEHTAVVYLNRMIIFGGYDGKRKLNDTYVFDFATKTWSCPNLAMHNPPSRRCKHTAVLYEKEMYVLGGFQYNDGNNYALTDLHALDLHTFVWRSILMNDGCPQALQGHKAVVANDCMYVVGGKVRMPSSANSAHGDTRSTGLNHSVFCYNFETYRWSVLAISGVTPTPRQLHAAVVVPQVRNHVSIYLFGGTDKQKQVYYDELWQLRSREVVPDNSCACCSSTAHLLNNEQFSDVHFIVEDKKVFAHRAILYSRSDHFRIMFDSQMRESEALCIPIQNVSYNVFLSVLEYLYTRKVNVHSGQHAVELLKAADMFRIDELRAYCVSKVEQAITVDNVCDICYIADTHNTESLKQFCMRFIINNFKRVINSDSFLQLMREDCAGLGKEILNAVADAFPAVSAAAHKQSFPSLSAKRARK